MSRTDITVLRVYHSPFRDLKNALPWFNELLKLNEDFKLWRRPAGAFYASVKPINEEDVQENA